MRRIHISSDVEADIESIWEFIASDNPAAATRLRQRILNAFESIARNPAIGHTRKDLAPQPTLFWPLGNYLILYRDLGIHIEIIAVTQGSRDIPTFLRSR